MEEFRVGIAKRFEGLGERREVEGAVDEALRGGFGEGEESITEESSRVVEDTSD
jgi:hypothetical protein